MDVVCWFGNIKNITDDFKKRKKMYKNLISQDVGYIIIIWWYITCTWSYCCLSVQGWSWHLTLTLSFNLDLRLWPKPWLSTLTFDFEVVFDLVVPKWAPKLCLLLIQIKLQIALVLVFTLLYFIRSQIGFFILFKK